MRVLKSLRHDESGVAYGLFVIAFFIISATILYVMMVESAAQTTDIMNNLIGQNLVSQKTRNTYDGQMTLITYSPIFMLFGVFAWGIVRSLEKKRTEG